MLQRTAALSIPSQRLTVCPPEWPLHPCGQSARRPPGTLSRRLPARSSSAVAGCVGGRYACDHGSSPARAARVQRVPDADATGVRRVRGRPGRRPAGDRRGRRRAVHLRRKRAPLALRPRRLRTLSASLAHGSAGSVRLLFLPHGASGPTLPIDARSDEPSGRANQSPRGTDQKR